MLPQEHNFYRVPGHGVHMGCEKRLLALHYKVQTCLSCFNACLALLCSSSSGSMPAAAAACHSRTRAPLQAKKHTTLSRAGGHNL